MSDHSIPESRALFADPWSQIHDSAIDHTREDLEESSKDASADRPDVVDHQDESSRLEEKVEPDGEVPFFGRRRSAATAISIAVLIVAAATWFSQAQSVEDIATEGAIGVRAEAALSAAAVARNRVAQVGLISQAVDLGVAEPIQLESAIGDSQAAVDEFEARIIQLESDLGDSLGTRRREFAGLLQEALAAEEAGDMSEAALAREAADDAFQDVAAVLIDLRNRAMAEMVVARDTAGQVAVASRLVVAFLIPLGAVLLYRFTSLRAARRRELLRSLESERATLRAKDDLLANISHELRTPLTGILGFAQTAALDPDLNPEDIQGMVEVIAGEADELSRMVEDLITTARDDQGALVVSTESFDLATEMDAVLIPLEIAQRQIRVDLEPVSVEADRLRFRQILRNLVSNALKHGGNDIALEGSVVDGAYDLVVSDDGAGVPPDLAERLFTRFVHQGNAPLTTGSIGLGLAIARRLAELMDGSLTYARVDDRTKFTLTLPLAETSPSATSASDYVSETESISSEPLSSG